MYSLKALFIILSTCLVLTAGLVILFSLGKIGASKKITEAECLLFAKEIELSIDRSDPSFLNNALHHYSFLKKVAGKLGPYDKAQLANLSGQMKDDIRFGDMVMSYLKSNDSYFNFTKLYFKNRSPHIIFRIYSQMESLNYFDCEIDKINGKLNITDVFIYFAGELWSTTYSRHLKLLGLYNNGDLEAIHRDNDFYNSLVKVDHINDLITEGFHDQAEQLYNSIPEDFQKDKFIQGIAVKIAHQKSDSVYANAIHRYQSSDPKNKAFNTFFDVLCHLALRENEKARQSIAELNELTGQDDLLQLFIGQTFQNEQLHEKAIPYFNNVIEQYPDLFEVYWYKMESLIQLKQYSLAIEFLDTIIANFKARKLDLEDLLAVYPDFINSNPYLKWRNRINI